MLATALGCASMSTQRVRIGSDIAAAETFVSVSVIVSIALFGAMANSCFSFTTPVERVMVIGNFPAVGCVIVGAPNPLAPPWSKSQPIGPQPPPVSPHTPNPSALFPWLMNSQPAGDCQL